MTLDKCFDQIESLLYQANLSVASGMSGLLVALESTEVVQGLIAELDSRNAIAALRDRIDCLCGKAADENRIDCDESLVTYLYALSKADPDLARDASHQIMRARGLFWSRRMALRLLEGAEAEAIPSGE